MIRVLAALCDQVWATTPQTLNMLLNIVLRKNDVEAYRQQYGEQKPREKRPATNGDGVAQIDIVGPLFRYANLFTDCSGATSVEKLQGEFRAAMAAPNVRSIVLNINSPGGEADGIGELAAEIFAARGHKPVTAYVGGMAASGAYWLASAAELIIMHETAQAGSIGVVATLIDDREAMEKEGIKRYEVVSSQSPDKRPPAGSDQARALVQGTVDSMADVFIQRVAQYRGVDPQHVIDNFGKGYTRLGGPSVGVGMADQLGSLKERFVEREERSMAVEDTRDLRAEERARMKAILESQEAKGRAKLANYLAMSTDYPVEQALGILANSESNTFVEQMRKTENPVVGVPKEDTTMEDDYQKEVAEIMKFV